MSAKLMILLIDRVSDFLRKGEITDRYYNPGNVFDEVHIVMLNDDRPDPAAVQRMVGRARLQLHNLPGEHRLFIRTLGWQPMLLESAVLRPGVDLARRIRPTLVRTYNNFVEGFLARRIKRELGVPYVVSLHGVWDRDALSTFRGKLIHIFRRKLERASLEDSDVVIAVYVPIVRYARAYGAKDVRLIYNIVAGWNIEPKTSYALGSRPRLVTVNRQLPEKNPENIIRAVARMDCEYLIVGDGPYHERLRKLARDLSCADRVRFEKAIANDKLVAMLHEFDVMVSHCDYLGMSKTVIEASLAGLPCVINRHPIEPIPEYEGGWIKLCENTPEGYREAITMLAFDEAELRRLGELARVHAIETFDPVRMEARTADIYRRATARGQAQE